MTVPADSAKDQVQAATTGLVDLREDRRWAGGSLMYDGGEQLVTGWHFHDVHEIEYACRGMVEVKTEAGHYLIFNSHLGMSWRTYLLRARVLRSMALLAQPDRSVLEVSIAVGFDDAGAFARSFARHCGETPSAYKRRISGAS